MKIVILCGGKGTRLREETEYRPKPMVPIGNRPILWHIMKTYAHYGHKEFILCLGYKGEMLKDYFRNYLWHTCDMTLRLGREPAVQFHNRHDEEDWSVTLADTGLESMTAYRVRQIQKYLGNAGSSRSATSAWAATCLPSSGSSRRPCAFQKALWCRPTRARVRYTLPSWRWALGPATS